MEIRNIIVVACFLGLTCDVSAEDFVRNGSINFTQTFYGNAGSYKTATSHPSLSINYNLTPKWNVLFEWDRTWNMYNYTGAPNQQDNSYSAPELTLTNTYGALGHSKVNWSTTLSAKYEDDYDNIDQAFIMAQTSFDFSSYIPKKKYLNITQLALVPMYYYGWNSTGPSGHTNSAVLSLQTNTQFTADLSWMFNAYGIRSWNRGNSFLTNSDDKSETANYFMIISYLNYGKKIYNFNDKASLDFNFVTGFDPWVSSNKQTTVEPFLVGEEMYEWLSPTVFNGTYHNTFTFFVLPQIKLNYTVSKNSSFNFFVQTKYSNQVWGNSEKGWTFQPQGGFGITHNF